MCQQCVDAIKKYWPDLPRKDYHVLLYDGTGFPLVPAEVVAKQVAELAEWSGCNLRLACHLADMDQDFAVVNTWRYIWPLQYVGVSDFDLVV